MKKITFMTSVFAILMSIVVLAPSCKKKDDPTPPPVNNTPVLNTDFSYTVVQNTINFTTTLTGNVWINNETSDVTVNFVDGACSVFVPKAGDHPFTCQILISGQVYKSEVFNVAIAQDDLSYLEKGYWKALSGGIDKTKTWRMDMNSSGKCVYFDGPLYYSGYEKDAVRLPYCAWDVLELPYVIPETGDEMTSFFNWSPDYPGNTWIMSAQDYGTITFSGTDLKASTSKFGAAATGSFTFDTTTMKMMLTGVTLPTDTSRINEGQVENWGDIRVFSLTDSSMQLGLKRVYEGLNEDGTKKESKWVLVYNFVCADYNYPVPESFTYSEPIKTSFTQADLVGTWKYDDVPMGWIGYTKIGDQGTNYPAHLFEAWYTRADVVTTLTGWGAGAVDSTFTANDAYTFVFNGDGSCNLAGIDNSYSVSNGVITFGNELAGTEFTGIWISMTGTEMVAIDFNKMGPETEMVDTPFTGLWIGQNNDGKSEYRAVQLVKQ